MLRGLLIIFLIFGSLLILRCSSVDEVAKSEPGVGEFVGKLELNEPQQLTVLFDSNVQAQVLANGFGWTEGPVWWPQSESLLFSDIPGNKIYQWQSDGRTGILIDHSGSSDLSTEGPIGGSNGLALDHDGNLLICQHGDRRIASLSLPLQTGVPVFHSVIDRFEGKRLNSPNDLIVSRNGDIYFTDPTFGLPGGQSDPNRELDFQGVFRLSSEGQLTLIDDQLSAPNGIALSPDEKTLYVSNADKQAAYWYAYRLESQGQGISRRLLADATDVVGNGKSGLPDGMVVDREGTIFASGPGGVWIFANDGKLLGKFKTGTAVGNLTFDASQTNLYIAADSRILRIPVKR